MNSKNFAFSEAVVEIETILANIESGKTPIDDLIGEVKQASKLLKECKEKLFQIEQELGEIVIDDNLLESDYE